MLRIILRHLSGSRISQTDEFFAGDRKELVIGREKGCNICFDADRDDLVGRRHASITEDPSEPGAFHLLDLQSRNGTFVNRQRISGKTRIKHSDVLQLGPGGPELRFELDPPPAAGVRETRRVGSSDGDRPVPPTRPAATPIRPDVITPESQEIQQAPRPIGRATVERFMMQIERTTKGESRKAMLVGLSALAAVVGVGVITWSYQHRTNQRLDAINLNVQKMRLRLDGFDTRIEDFGRDNAQNLKMLALVSDSVNKLRGELKAAQANAGNSKTTGGQRGGSVSDGQSSGASQSMLEKSGGQIAAENQASIVKLQIGWYLVDAGTGRRVQHKYERIKALEETLDKKLQECAQGCSDLNNNQIQAMKQNREELGKLVDAGLDKLPVYQRIDDDIVPVLTYEDPDSRYISGKLTGTGFLTLNGDYILTNRHVAAPWRSSYDLETEAGFLYGDSPKGRLAFKLPVDRWVPDSPGVFVDATTGELDREKLHKESPNARNLQGLFTYLDVLFPGSTKSLRGTLLISSDRQDVALVKVDLPQGRKGVELATGSHAAQGDHVCIMGYPGDATQSTTKVADDSLDHTSFSRSILAPKYSEGAISSVPEKDSAAVNPVGNYYELSTGAGVAPGSSGGPVFDRFGRVIGIVALLDSRGREYAVPIEYGADLLNFK